MKFTDTEINAMLAGDHVSVNHYTHVEDKLTQICSRDYFIKDGSLDYEDFIMSRSDGSPYIYVEHVIIDHQTGEVSNPCQRGHVCWVFESVCNFNGNCNNCPKLREYNNSCK